MTTVTCLLCSFTAKTEKEMDLHRARTHTKIIDGCHRCTRCCFMASTQEQLASHSFKSHREEVVTRLRALFFLQQQHHQQQQQQQQHPKEEAAMTLTLCRPPPPPPPKPPLPCIKLPPRERSPLETLADVALSRG